MPKLNQVIAIEKGIKQSTYSELTELHKVSQKADLFNGFSKVYSKKYEDGEDYPAERKKVQMNAVTLLETISTKLTELFDVTASKDVANCSAVADLVVDGKTLATGVPATFLLFLEKQLNDINTFVSKLPVLDDVDEWFKDDNSGLSRTNPIQTHRTKKVQKPIVLYDATDKHPAQTQLITEDVIAGYWDTTKYSGALSAPSKAKLLDRIKVLSQAVKQAREAANMVEAPRVNVGRPIFEFLFNS